MTEKLLEELDQCWDYDNGFFVQLKQRVFDRVLFDKVINILRDIHFGEGQEDIPRRLVSLLWYIPLFMEWNAENVLNQIPRGEYNNCKNLVENELERILGIP
jgi:hypothetical protein